MHAICRLYSNNVCIYVFLFFVLSFIHVHSLSLSTLTRIVYAIGIFCRFFITKKSSQNNTEKKYKYLIFTFFSPFCHLRRSYSLRTSHSWDCSLFLVWNSLATHFGWQSNRKVFFLSFARKLKWNADFKTQDTRYFES